MACKPCPIGVSMARESWTSWPTSCVDDLSEALDARVALDDCYGSWARENSNSVAKRISPEVVEGPGTEVGAQMKDG